MLGAIVAPTDATAVAAVAGRLQHRQLTILRAESLINDGTALVVFAIAVSVTTGERELTWYAPLGDFALSYLGGAAVGLVVAWLPTKRATVVRLRDEHVISDTVLLRLQQSSTRRRTGSTHRPRSSRDRLRTSRA